MSKQILVSIELTNVCLKGNQCRRFGCYAKSMPDGETFWKPEELGGFVRNLAANGVQAVSFGGGEPLQYEELWALLDLVSDVPIFKSATSNGLLLTPLVAQKLVGKLDKLHISIHFPENPVEVSRVLDQYRMIETMGIIPGINFLVKGENKVAEKRAVQQIKDAGIPPERIVFLPLRGKGHKHDPELMSELAMLMGSKFQSTWCLLECKKSDRFVSIDWQGRVGWCSYTPAKTKMKELTYDGMLEALNSKELAFCG